MADKHSIDPAGSEDRLTRVFGALSDPSRRRIIALLRESGDLKVTDVAEVFAMSFNGVSKHIKVLERAGLISRRIEGRDHWLCVDWAGLKDAYAWLDFHRHFWSERLDSLTVHVSKQSKDEGK